MPDQSITDISELTASEELTAVLPVINTDDEDGDWRKVAFSALKGSVLCLRDDDSLSRQCDCYTYEP